MLTEILQPDGSTTLELGSPDRGWGWAAQWYVNRCVTFKDPQQEERLAALGLVPYEWDSTYQCQWYIRRTPLLPFLHLARWGRECVLYRVLRCLYRQGVWGPCAPNALPTWRDRCGTLSLNPFTWQRRRLEEAARSRYQAALPLWRGRAWANGRFSGQQAGFRLGFLFGADHAAQEVIDLLPLLGDPEREAAARVRYQQRIHQAAEAKLAELRPQWNAERQRSVPNETPEDD